MMSARALLSGLFGLVLLAPSVLSAPARAADLYNPNSWSAMATDRRAERVGDSLTVVVYENSLAQNSSTAGSQKNTQLSAQASAGSPPKAPAQASLSGQFDSQAQTGRSGKLVAQITVVVDAVLPNGDLHVSGQQVINVAGDHTKISLKGRVRPEDIASGNQVLSTRLADATINYDGTGLVSRGAKPGPINTVLNWLGLL